MQREYVIITAGGTGSRMGSEKPKQFLELNGLPLLMHSIKAFFIYSVDIEIIVTLPEIHISGWGILCDKHQFRVRHQVCPGGETRFDSVRNGLSLIKGEGLVAVHDGARPLVSVELIARCFELAKSQGNAVPVIAPTDSVREVLNGESRPAERERLRLVQTPQVFDSALLRSAYGQGYRNSFTDDATVVEAFGAKINLLEGDPRNLKITRPDDLLMAEALGPHRSTDL